MLLGRRQFLRLLLPICLASHQQCPQSLINSRCLRMTRQPGNCIPREFGPALYSRDGFNTPFRCSPCCPAFNLYLLALWVHAEGLRYTLREVEMHNGYEPYRFTFSAIYQFLKYTLASSAYLHSFSWIYRHHLLFEIACFFSLRSWSFMLWIRTILASLRFFLLWRA